MVKSCSPNKNSSEVTVGSVLRPRNQSFFVVVLCLGDYDTGVPMCILNRDGQIFKYEHKNKSYPEWETWEDIGWKVHA